MSNANWNTVEIKKREKNTSTEDVYYLSQLIHDGACTKCLANNCNYTESHGISFPEKIKVFVRNPLFIPEIKEEIENAKLDFGNLKPIYTTCNFTHINKDCNNCRDGRIKIIKFKDSELLLCHSSLEAAINKITVGIHFDIKLIMKGKNYAVSAIPVDFRHILDYLQNKENEIIDNIPNEEPEQKPIENWPTLNDNVSVQKHSWGNALLEKLKTPVKQEENFQEEKSNQSLNNAPILSLHELEFRNRQLVHDIQTKRLQLDIVDISLENNHLYLENIDLRDELEFLTNKYNALKRQFDNECYMNKNREKYEEMLNNLEHLTNRVSQQFLETNYSDYVMHN
jgi:hypothetical protein